VTSELGRENRAAVSVSTLTVTRRRAATRMRLPGRISLGLIIPVLILGLWEFVTATQILPSAVMPGPVEVWESFLNWAGVTHTPRMFYTGMLFVDAGATLGRVACGFLMATVIGVALGIAIGVWRTADEIFTPTIRVLGPIPPVTWLPVVIVILGVGPASNLALIVIGGAFPVIASTITAVSGVNRELLRAGRMMGRGQLSLIGHVIFPAALPGILGGMRIGLGLSWVMAVTSEMLAVHSGLGYTLWNAYNYFNYSQVFAAMIITGLCGLATDFLLQLSMRRFTRWHVETGVRA
jgi:NitT/TauT family transport system permease protein